MLQGKIDNTLINCLKSDDIAKSMDKDGRDQEERLLSRVVERETVKQRLQFKDTKGWWGQGQKRHNRTSHAIDWKQFLRVANVLQPQPSRV